MENNTYTLNLTFTDEIFNSVCVALGRASISRDVSSSDAEALDALYDLLHDARYEAAIAGTLHKDN